MTEIRLTHIGGPTCLIEVGPWRLLTDPTFDPPGRRYGFGFGTSSTKLAGPALAVSALGAIDAVLLSHDHHADNLDEAGRALLPAVGTVLTTRSGARRLRGNAQGLAPWAVHTLTAPGRPGIRVTATPCRHGPPLSRPLAGAVIGFALAWEGQQHGQVWITGDTVRYRGLQLVPARLTVGTMIVHLGCVGFSLTGPARYTMSAADALDLCDRMSPRTIVPVHYEGWSHFREAPAAAAAAFAAAPATLRDRLRWLTPGTAAVIAV